MKVLETPLKEVIRLISSLFITKRAKRSKRAKKQTVPKTLTTLNPLKREEMPWLRLKYQTEEVLTKNTPAEI